MLNNIHTVSFLTQMTLSEGVHMFVDKMWNHILKVSNIVDELKYPTGSRESPAVSCKDIKKSYDGYQDGILLFCLSLFVYLFIM